MAAVLVMQAGAANAACLTEPQFQAAIRFVAPDLIRVAANKCGGLLPAGSYLGRNGNALADRYRPGAAGAWPEVKAALAAQPDLSLFASMDEATVRGLFAPILAQRIAKENFKAADCQIADEIAASLDPLPPQNLIALITAFARFDKGKPAKKAGGKPRPPILCRAPTR
jgi:hypothetical protein